MTTRNLRMFEYARQEAEKSDFHKYRVGCVIAIGPRVISKGHNSEKSHTFQKQFNKYRDLSKQGDSVIDKLHAEINALLKIRYAELNWNKVEIYVYRIKTDTEHGMARPCPSCMEAIRSFGIRHVLYTTDDGFCYEQIGA